MCHVALKFVRLKSWNTKNSVTMQPSLVQGYSIFSCPKLDLKISVQMMVRTYKAFQDIFQGTGGGGGRCDVTLFPKDIALFGTLPKVLLPMS